MSFQKYMGQVIENQVSDEFFFTEVIDCDKFDALKGADSMARSGDIQGALERFEGFIRSFLDPHMFDDLEVGVGGVDCINTDTPIEAADRALRHDFVSCGVEHQFDSETVDWLHNPTPDSYREFTWQFQRHHEFFYLMNAYRVTGDEKYARGFKELIMSWIMQASPAPLDVTGGETDFWRTIECGIRMLGSWPVSICTFSSSLSLDGRDWVNIFKCVYEHALRLEKQFTTSNWLIMEMNGLVHIGLLFPFFKRAKEWENFAMDKLFEQLDAQIFADGFQQELTTNYHQVVVNNYEDVLLIYKKTGKQPKKEMLAALESMYNIYPHIVKPDLNVPNLNDGADFNTSLTLARATDFFPQREDFLYLKTGRKEGKEPEILSNILPYSGYVTFRSDWSKDAFWCLFNAARFGFGHQHEDKLEVLIHAYGEYLLPEAGRAAYDGSKLFNYSLLTNGHNTVMTDGLSQRCRDHSRWDPAVLNTPADVYFNSQDYFDCAEACYDQNYGEQNVKVKHNRRVIWLKNPEGTNPLVVTVDRMYNLEDYLHKYTAIWHFADGDYNFSDREFSVKTQSGVGIKMIHTLDSTQVYRADGDRLQGFRCNEVPGKFWPLPTAECEISGGDMRFVTVFEPSSNGEYNISSVEAETDIEADKILIHLENGRTVRLNESDYFCEKLK